jgi:ankyrin repeat protein
MWLYFTNIRKIIRRYLFMSIINFLRFIYSFGADANEMLIDSVYRGDFETAKYALQDGFIHSGADINIRSDGYTPLHLALLCGRFELVKMLIERGADVNAKSDQEDLTPLHLAIVIGNIESITLLIEKGANIEAKSSFGTPLHYATYYEKPDVAQLLLDKGADVNAKSENNDPALHIAIENNNLNMRIAKLLLENKAYATEGELAQLRGLGIIPKEEANTAQVKDKLKVTVENAEIKADLATKFSGDTLPEGHLHSNVPVGDHSSSSFE